MAQDLSPHDAEKAVAQWQAGVGAARLASVYAEAVLGAAQSAGQAEALLDEFDALVSGVLDRFPALEQVLGSALVSHEEKSGILDRVLGGRSSPLLLNSLKVMSRHGRLDCVRAVHRRLRELYDERRGRVPVTLATAVPVDDAAAARLVAGLRAMTGGEPVVKRVVDPDLIGGAVVRVGDTVYDGSVANQLENVRKQMIDRSAHEIQSRRDRFRHPAGD